MRRKYHQTKHFPANVTSLSTFETVNRWHASERVQCGDSCCFLSFALAKTKTNAGAFIVESEIMDHYVRGPQRRFCDALQGEALEIWTDVLARLEEDDEVAPLIERYDNEFYWRFVQGCMFETTRQKREKLSFERIKKTLIWRQEKEVDQVWQQDFPNLDIFRESVWPLRLCGMDSEGHAVSVIRLRDMNWKTAVKTFDKKQVLRYMILHQEILLERLKAMRANSRQIIIFDIGGLSGNDYRLAYKNGLGSIFGLWSNHYPESVHHLFILNSPFVFRAVFSAIKPWIEPDTLLKIRILTKPQREVLKELRDREFPVELLPEWLSGEKSEEVFVIPDKLVQDYVNGVGPSRADEILRLHLRDIEEHGFLVPGAENSKPRATSGVFDDDDPLGGLDPGLAMIGEAEDESEEQQPPFPILSFFIDIATRILNAVGLNSSRPKLEN